MTLRITSDELSEITDDRYHRQRLIGWWDQALLARSRILVVGAGALGNEVLKLLALTGVGRIVVVDLDRIERSNLSRGVLFRDDDLGQLKTDQVATRAMELNPDVVVRPLGLDIVLHGGLGLFLWADLVIGAVDNREARVFINSACAATGRTWIDGAMQELSGVVRGFDPARGPCYECTMNATDRRLLAERQSCARLAREAVARGHTPSTAVTASITGAFQVLEALKVLHGQPAAVGEGMHIEGFGGEISRVRYPRREDCMGHETLPAAEGLGLGIHEISVGDLLRRAEVELGPGAVLDLSRDVILSLECPSCGTREPGRAVVGAIKEQDAACPACGTHRMPETASSISWDLENGPDLDETTLGDLGLPGLDIIVARQGLDRRLAWVFDGDVEEVLGPLAESFPTLGMRRSSNGYTT